MPLPGLKFWNAIANPNMGMILKINIQINPGRSIK
jgi:hypothetical protein